MLGLLLMLTCGTGLFGLTPATALAQPANEYEIKSAMVFNIAKFIEFPAGVFPHEKTPLTICTLGKGSFTQTLESLQGKTARGRSIVIRHIATSDEIAGCNVLAIGDSERYQLPSILEKSALHGVLTISDMRKFAPSGGIIGLYSQDDKIRFEVNLDAAHHAKIKISSQLLKLARIIQTK